ncbi:uncharacterized protein DC041_0009711 [Schistosoma bovis]|uniref:Uncharacterized protein n=1 Tax=Schistosoma bovis TaxID=6184 RepID=A0A430QFY8_SCHBO|nr:uncharacterized protein DC041_0009711 [Schistosoma bovis]
MNTINSVYIIILIVKSHIIHLPTARSFLFWFCTFTIDNHYHDDTIVKMSLVIAFIVVTTAAIADAADAIIVFVVSVKNFHLLNTFLILSIF